LSYDENILLQLAVGTPTVMAVAWLFSEIFERPFTRDGILLPAAKRLFNKEAPRAAPL
jgi:peptidoglycan/LPS O-acetylase OafA/YrhL